MKTNLMNLQTIDSEICTILTFQASAWENFSTTFYAQFFQKNVFHIIFYQLTKFYYMTKNLNITIGQGIVKSFLTISVKYSRNLGKRQKWPKGLSITVLTNFQHFSIVIYNHFHNISRHFIVLPNFLFTTSKTMRDNYL